MGLKDSIKAIQEDLPISERADAWLSQDNPRYSDRALEFAANQLAGISGSNRLRKRMFRASSAGTCSRKQVFGYIGVPRRVEISSKLANIFSTGSFLHLKWQMHGLTEGWLLDAEVPADCDDINAGGTMDGIIYTGGGFEFKSINSNGYRGVMQFGPKGMHDFQVHHYMFFADLDHFSIIYEDKDTGEWREFLIRRNEETIDKVENHIKDLNAYVDAKVLPPILDDCKAKTGAVYRNCPFRDMCLKQRSVWPFS